MQKRQVLINAIMSMVQIVVVSGVLFILYKFLLNAIGVEQLGIWSLVLATTSVTQIANFGLSGSVVKFVAKYIARGEEENVSSVIQTATISVSLIGGFILLSGYPAIKWILTIVIPRDSIHLAIKLLPFSLFSLWLTIIANIFYSGLDGYQRIYIRNILVMCGMVFYLVLCVMFAPAYGLIGLAVAQIMQNIIVLLGSWFLIRRYSAAVPVVPYQWNKTLFREMIGYGINFQVISVTGMLYDPITKALLSRFGGLSMVGYYEMANRMIQQFRALIVSANQVVVPAIADLQEDSPEKIKDVYLTLYRLFFYLALLLYSVIIITTPIISKLWIGHYENGFILFSTLLAVGWFLNTLGAPAYFANLGIGELGWNTIGHLTIAILNLGLGFGLGGTYGGKGVVVAWVFSLIAGSFIIPFSYHLKYEIPLTELLPKEHLNMFLACIISILVSVSIYRYLSNKANLFLIASTLMAMLLTIVGVSAWFHPLRKRLAAYVASELFRK
jgi:O-antigen/teichoic acid export membrane protein